MKETCRKRLDKKKALLIWCVVVFSMLPCIMTSLFSNLLYSADIGTGASKYPTVAIVNAPEFIYEIEESKDYDVLYFSENDKGEILNKVNCGEYLGYAMFEESSSGSFFGKRNEKYEMTIYRPENSEADQIIVNFNEDAEKAAAKEDVDLYVSMQTIEISDAGCPVGEESTYEKIMSKVYVSSVLFSIILGAVVVTYIGMATDKSKIIKKSDLSFFSLLMDQYEAIAPIFIISEFSPLLGMLSIKGQIAKCGYAVTGNGLFAAIVSGDEYKVLGIIENVAGFGFSVALAIFSIRAMEIAFSQKKHDAKGLNVWGTCFALCCLDFYAMTILGNAACYIPMYNVYAISLGMVENTMSNSFASIMLTINILLAVGIIEGPAIIRKRKEKKTANAKVIPETKPEVIEEASETIEIKENN